MVRSRPLLGWMLAVAMSVPVTAAAAAGSSVIGVPAANPRSTRVITRACTPKHYRVRPGDTLSSISRHFGISIGQLAATNALDPQAVLPIGIKLVIARPCTKAPSAFRPKRSITSDLAAALDRAIATPGVSRERTGVVVVDLNADRVVYRHNPETPLEPASTEKLPLAITVMQRLGVGFRTSTDVLGQGKLVGSAWRGDLVLKGYGDPTLTSDDLHALAHAVRNRGITAVTGGITADESYFDSARAAPGWKPSFAKSESPLLSALIVNRGVLDGVAVDDPARAAAALFKRALQGEGVTIVGELTSGRASSRAVLLGRRASPPLITLLAQMDTWSDNFIAEMLLKQLGARIAGHGTTSAGARVVASTLTGYGIPTNGVRLADGSGLSTLNRLTARTLAATLETIAHTTSLHPLLGTFAIAGATGTLRHRLPGVPNRQLVRGKTGTTDSSSALAGFAGSRYAFAILCNGSPVNWTAAHRLQDRIAQALLAATA